MQKPLVAPALFFAAGIAAARVAPARPVEGAVCAAAFGALAWVSFGRGSGRLGLVCAWLGCAALGLWNGAARGGDRVAPVQPKDGVMAGCVVESSVVRNERLQFTLELATGGRARVSISPGRDGRLPAPVPYGARVEVEARLRAVRGFHNPGAFDVEEYQARRGIYWNATVDRGMGVRRLEGECGPGWRRAIERWRARTLARIDSLYPGDGYHAAMLRGLLLGDKSGIRASWTDAYRRTGTYHALVISGSHITLVCGLLLLWKRRFGYGERTVVALAGAVAWVYALMAGAEPPVLRSAAGFGLYVAATLLYRRTSLLNVLAGVAILFLAVDPAQLFDASFQLSFLAVAALGVFTPEEDERRAPARGPMALMLELRLMGETAWALAGLREEWWVKLRRLAGPPVERVWTVLRVSAGVQMGLALPMVLLFHRVSFTSLAANLVVAPVISCAIPLGFGAVFTGWPALAGATAWLLDAAQAAAEWHLRWEPALRVPDPPWWVCASIPAAFVGWAAARHPGWRAGWAAAALGLLAAMIFYPFEPKVERGGLELAALDVGQGESLALTLPDGGVALVDTGGLPQHNRRAPTAFDVGEEVVSPYLWGRGVRRIEVLAVTHLHDDHAGGAAALIDNFRPKELWTGFAPEHAVWRRLEERARAAGTRVRVLKQGEEFDYGGARWQVLAPGREQEWRVRPRNNDSLVLRVRYGRQAFLLTGDIERRVEGRLVEEGLAERTQVLKVAHHGSRLSSFEPLLDALRPAVAVISAGAGNSYGLPARQVLDELRARRALILRTDEDGLVRVRTDGRCLEVDRPGRTARDLLRWDAF